MGTVAREQKVTAARYIPRGRQADLTRALRAAKAAGVEVARITVDKDGRIILELVTAATGKQAAATPLDEWLAVHAS